ncbi:MAG: bifunctional aspartate kinase/homoserine dehydrogenase I [Deltaproteobacteria bacterium]|nr:bifunctional aspartate kinase/homoserine dehydrogenase I [Deltaproteobacteria bacterium]
MTTAPWVVHKFGGTSVASAQRYRDVAAIVAREPGVRKAVVVSAMAKVTDALIALTELARARDESYVARLAELVERHVETAKELLPEPECLALTAVLRADAADIADVLRAIWLARTCSEELTELVSGYGEIWSAQMLGAHLAVAGKSARWLDARKVLVVRPGETGPVVDWSASRALLMAWLASEPTDELVITGFVAQTPEGVPTTLKRNGSDFSASIFGSLLDASAVTIWTDVDGVLSADPRRVPEAVVLDEMSYDEAMELAYFGAKVLHPRTMAPCVAQAIPIWIRNTFNPTHPGTRIHRAEPAKAGAPSVKGFSTIDGIALINVEGTGMMGVPGVAQRIFGSLRSVSVSVVMISQASSEHSVCFAVPEAQAGLAHATVEKAFASEVHRGQIERVDVVLGCSVLAAVGERMADTPGVAARLFGSLSKAGINVRAIAQGSSERNISLVVDRADSTRALRAVHAGFYLSDQVISVGVVGPGLVGRALLAQLEAQAPLLRARFKLDLRVRAIASSTRMVLGDPSLAADAWEGGGPTVPTDLTALAEHIRPSHLPHAVIIDCSASDAVAERYAGWLDRGIHVITPNKRAGAGPLERYRAIKERAQARRTRFFYEATVGAGLPVITTLRDLIQTGDRVTRIEGVLSGTLSYVFNSYTGERGFSEVVRQAKALGYTEPDPRDDLAGTDVARKLVILGREMDLPMELDAVAVQSLVPEALRGADVEAFMTGLADFDAPMAAALEEARAAGEVLRYVGVIEADGRASASLRRYPLAHPFARVGASDNILAFTTARYHTQPLIVQGPGAGPEVTAGGVFADLLRLASSVG